jgi:hypothetical protein
LSVSDDNRSRKRDPFCTLEIIGDVLLDHEVRSSVRRMPSADLHDETG